MLFLFVGMLVLLAVNATTLEELNIQLRQEQAEFSTDPAIRARQVEAAFERRKAAYRAWALGREIPELNEENNKNSQPVSFERTKDGDKRSGSIASPKTSLGPTSTKTDAKQSDKYNDRVCKQVQCNFESETMCNWASLGRLAIPGRTDDATEEENQRLQALLESQGLTQAQLTEYLRSLNSRDREAILAKISQAVSTDSATEPLAWYSYRKLGASKYSVPNPGEKLYYAGAYVLPGETARMETTLFNFTQETEVKFMAYEAAEQVQLRFCCNTVNLCPWSSNYNSKNSDFKWLNVRAVCPKNTEKLIFLCNNFGSQEAACGLDNVRLDGYSCAQSYVPRQLNSNRINIDNTAQQIASSRRVYIGKASNSGDYSSINGTIGLAGSLARLLGSTGTR